MLFMRLVGCPLVMLPLMKILKEIFASGADKVLLISFLACITPSAATIMQFAQITDNNEDYATAINILSTVLCIATMPVFVELYNLL